MNYEMALILAGVKIPSENKDYIKTLEEEEKKETEE